MRDFIKFIMKGCLVAALLMITTVVSAKPLNDDFSTFIVSQDNQQIFSIHPAANNTTRELHVTNIATGKLIKKITLPLLTDFSWYKPQMAVTPDGKKLYVVDINKKLYFVDVVKGTVDEVKNKPSQDTGEEVSSAMSLSPDGKRLYIADGTPQLHSPAVMHILDTTTNNISKTIEDNRGWRNGLSVLDADASHLYISRWNDYYNSEISVLNTQTQLLDRSTMKIDLRIDSMAMNPQNKLLYAVGDDYVYVIDPVNKRIIDRINTGLNNKLKSIVFAAHGNTFYALNTSGTTSSDGVLVFDAASKTSKLIPISPLYDDAEMKISMDGSKIYVNHADTIHVIDTTTERVVRDLKIN